MVYTQSASVDLLATAPLLLGDSGVAVYRTAVHINPATELRVDDPLGVLFGRATIVG